MKRCKHKNGALSEYATIENYKLIVDGKLSEFGDNNVGNITGYMFECFDCGKQWRYKFPPTKWLENIHYKLV